MTHTEGAVSLEGLQKRKPHTCRNNMEVTMAAAKTGEEHKRRSWRREQPMGCSLTLRAPRAKAGVLAME